MQTASLPRAWTEARWFRVISVLFGVIGPVGSIMAVNGGHGLQTWTTGTSVYVLATSAILAAWQSGRVHTRDGAAFVTGALGLAGLLALWGGLVLLEFLWPACEDLRHGRCTFESHELPVLILLAACAHLGTAAGAIVHAELDRQGDEPALSILLGAFSPALLAVVVDFLGHRRMGL